MISLFKVLSPKFCLDWPKTIHEIPPARHSPGTSSSSCPGQSQPPADPSRNFSSCRVRKKSSKCGRLNTKSCRQDGRRGKVSSPEQTRCVFRLFFFLMTGLWCRVEEGGRGEGGKRGTLPRGKASRGRRADAEVAGGDGAIGCAPEGVVLPPPNQIRGRFGGAVPKKGREEWRRFHLEWTVASSRPTAGGSGVCGDVLRLFYRHKQVFFCLQLGWF